MKPDLNIHQHIDHYRQEWPKGLAEVLHRIAGNKEEADKAAELLPEVRKFSVVGGAEMEKAEKTEHTPYFLPAKEAEGEMVPLVKPKEGKR